MVQKRQPEHTTLIAKYIIDSIVANLMHFEEKPAKNIYKLML